MSSTRTTNLRIRLTPAEKKAWIREAEKHSEGNISRYVRTCVNNAQVPEKAKVKPKARRARPRVSGVLERDDAQSEANA